MELFKQLLVLGTIACSVQATAQISNPKTEEKTTPTEQEQPKTVRRVPTDGLDEFTFYVGAGRVWGNRDLSSNAAPFGAPLGVRADETGLKLWSFQAGVRNRVGKYLSYDVGLAYDRTGESYSWEDTESDSTFKYASKYSYFAIPVQVLATYGKDFRFFLGGGLQPQLLAGFRQEQEWTTSLNSAGEETVKDTEGLNQFGLGVIASCGIQWRLNKGSSIYVTPTWLWNLNNTYDDQQDYIHKAHSFSLKFGLAFHLPETN